MANGVTEHEPGSSVKIVKIPIAWSMHPNEVIAMQMMSKDESKRKQETVIERRSKEETLGRDELETYLDTGYTLLSTVLLSAGERSFLVYTLYKSPTENEIPF